MYGKGFEIQDYRLDLCDAIAAMLEEFSKRLFSNMAAMQAAFILFE